jgi:hypothetical protein
MLEKMEIATQKKEIIDWILSIEDQTVLNEIEILKKQTSFDFDEDPSDSELAEQFKKGISGEELKLRTTEFLKTLPWKK